MKKNKFSLRDGYRRSFNLLSKSKHYIFGAFLVILFSSIIGFLIPGIFEKQVLKIIREIIAQLDGKSTFELIIYIFFNNFKASLFSLLMGVLFGVFPLLSGILNGYVIGFSAHLAVSEVGALVLWRLLPHGIFEIPAILFSMGIGFYLGSKLLEKRFKIKNEKYRIGIIFILCILVLPFGFAYYTLATQSLSFSTIAFANLTSYQITLMVLVALINILLIFLVGVILYYFIKDKNLRTELYDSLLCFVLIVVPLLIIAGIVEGILVGWMG